MKVSIGASEVSKGAHMMRLKQMRGMLERLREEIEKTREKKFGGETIDTTNDKRGLFIKDS